MERVFLLVFLLLNSFLSVLNQFSKVLLRTRVNQLPLFLSTWLIIWYWDDFGLLNLPELLRVTGIACFIIIREVLVWVRWKQVLMRLLLVLVFYKDPANCRWRFLHLVCVGKSLKLRVCLGGWCLRSLPTILQEVDKVALLPSFNGKRFV